MRDISDIFKFLNESVLPKHQVASFGQPLKISAPNPPGSRPSESGKITAQNQKMDHENSSFEASKASRLEDRKASSASAFQDAHRKTNNMKLQTQPKISNSKLQQQPQKLLTPKPKI